MYSVALLDRDQHGAHEDKFHYATQNNVQLKVTELFISELSFLKFWMMVDNQRYSMESQTGMGTRVYHVCKWIYTSECEQILWTEYTWNSCYLAIKLFSWFGEETLPQHIYMSSSNFFNNWTTHFRGWL